MTTRILPKKCKIRGQRGRGLGHVTYFYILCPFYISVTAKARNFKFGVKNEFKKFYQKVQN